MMAFVAIFLPSIIGIKILDYLENGLTLKNIIFYYLTFVTLSLGFNSVFSYMFFHINNVIVDNLNNLPIFFSKYLIISIIFNIILSVLFYVLKRNISFSIEVKSNEKSKKRIKKNK